MWLVYGISVLSNLGIVVTGTLMTTLFGGGFVLFVYLASEGEAKFPYPKTLITVLLSSILLVVVVPSEKTMYTMAGAYATQKIAEAPETKEIANKVLKIINEKLDSVSKK